MKDFLKDRLLKGYEAGHSIMMISMDRDEMMRVINLIDQAEEPKESQDYQTGYMCGFEYGYQRALVDVIKMLKGMKWYGGNNEKKHTGKMPDYPAGRDADLQQ